MRRTSSEPVRPMCPAPSAKAQALEGTAERVPEEEEEALDDSDGESSLSAGGREADKVTNFPSCASAASGADFGVRRNSQKVFAERMHTALVLDWDDTLFPTTWVREDCKLDYRYPLHNQPDLGPGERRDTIQHFLDKHLVRCEAFLMEAAAQANIFIVTLAKRGWVDTTIKHFMPGLAGAVERCALKVIYAQEFADPREISRYLGSAASIDPEESASFWTRVKSEAIMKELDEFHHRHDASWKNVISLGDSDFERYGTISAGQDYMRREMEGGSLTQTGHTTEGVSKDGHLKRLRVKTVKMLDKPTVLELTAQMVLLLRWLPHIVRRDSGFDLEIEGTDDDNVLVELHRQVTGEEDLSLSWQELAGMTE